MPRVRPSVTRDDARREQGSMRIALVIHSLACGGAEKVAVQLAGGLRDAGHEPVLVTLDDGAQDFHEPPAGVERRALDVAAPSRSLLDAVRHNRRHLRVLRQALESIDPDLALAFMDRTGVRTVLAARRLGVPVVIAERSDPRRIDAGPLWRRLKKSAYASASAVVSNSSEVADWLRTWLPPERVESVPNAVEIGRDAEPEFDLPPSPFLLSVGRLTQEKGHADLIRALAGSEKLRDWSLLLLGEGPERSRLSSLASAEGVAGRVHLPGRARNPWPFYRAADLFVLPSRREGFPNALLEAMAAGACCVACDTGSGAREIIRDGDNGRLVTSPQSLRDAIESLAAAPERRAALGARAREVTRRFRPERILAKWETLLTRHARGGSRAHRPAAR